MIYLCTLFDSNFIDKALVLLDSLHATEKEFVLHVASFDQKSCEILQQINDTNVEICTLDDLKQFEPRLISLEKERKRGEFCWTCTPILVSYLMQVKGLPECTYIDADMFFYTSPKVLLEKCNGSVGIMKHRFPKNRYYRLLEKHSGTYCVEFNYFKNDLIGQKVLREWKEACITECTSAESENGFGDQRYLQEWPQKYESIFTFSHDGAGIATWNIKDYSIKDGALYYCGQPVVPIFYHFSGLDYSNEDYVNTHVGDYDKDVADFFYLPYLKAIEDKRDLLKWEHGFDLRMRELRGDRCDNDEVRESFMRIVKAQIRNGNFIKAFRSIIERLYVSNYSRKHYGSYMDCFSYDSIYGVER